MSLFEQEQQGSIVPHRDKRSRITPDAIYLVGVAIASALVIWYLAVGVLLLGATTRSVLERMGLRKLPLVLVALLPAPVAYAWLASPDAAVALVPTYLLAVATATLMWGHRAGVSAMCATIAAASCVALAIDAYTVAQSGSDLATVTSSLMFEVTRETAGTGVASELAMGSVESMIKVLWPLTYPAYSVTVALMAAVGSYLSVARSGAKLPSLDAFRAPVWTVVVLVCGVAVLVAAHFGVDAAAPWVPAAATLVVCMRVIFALAGLGVALSLATAKRIGCVGRSLIIFLAVWAETMVYILSIVGLVDVVAHFRTLMRTEAPAETH